MVFIVAVLVRLPDLDRRLDGSEVDYVLAARGGFLTNYLDLGSRPVWEYVAAGLAMAGFGAEANADSNLWSRDAEAGDIAAYRHYHPPLFIYLLLAAEQLAGYSDVAVRLVPLAFSLATIAVAYLGCALLIPVRGAQIGLVAAAILAALKMHVATAVDIGWHVPYACLATVALFAMGYLATRPSLHALVAAAVATTIAFMTLEHAVFLSVTLVAVLVVTDNPWLRVSRSGVSMHRGLFVAVGACLLTMLVIWPASLLKLSIVKNLGVHAYYSSTLELSPRFYDVYLDLIARYPITIALAAVTAVVSVVRRSHIPRALLPFAIYVLAMSVLQAGNQNLKPLYFVSLLPPLALLSAVWIVDAVSAANPRIRLVARAGTAAASALGLAFIVQATFRALAEPNPNGELINRLAVVDGLVREKVLIWPAGSHAAQMLGFYLPEARFERVIEEPHSVRAAAAALQRGAFRFVVVEVAADEPGTGAPPALRNNYRRLFAIEGNAEIHGFEVWHRRD